MKKIEGLIKTWGFLDLLAVACFLGLNLYNKRFPIAHDLQKVIEHNTSFGLPSLVYIVIFGVIIYLSLILSGLLLFKLNKIGALINYFQLPFRFFTIIPPTFFFLGWLVPYGSIPSKFDFISAMAFLLITELFKTGSIIYWQKNV